MPLKSVTAAFLLTFAAFALRLPGAAQAQDDSASDGKPGDASISGRITYVDGTPAAKRIVEWRPEGDVNAGSTTLTDSDGLYAIEGLSDGAYLVGFFDPGRAPADKNPGITAVAESPSPELEAIGAPVGKRVVIAVGKSVTGVDFVITYIGPEVVVGPESGGAEIAGGLPASGSDGSKAPDPALQLTSEGLALAVAGAVALVVGVLLLGWAFSKRRRASA